MHHEKAIGEAEMKIQVLLSDDHRIMREAVRSLLDKDPDIAVVGEAEDGRSAVELTRKIKPHVVVMDVVMQGMNGIEATRQITQEMPDVKVLALSMHTHSWFIGKMKEAGAKGYLLKSCAFEELAGAIHTVFANQTYLSPSLVHNESG